MKRWLPFILLLFAALISLVYFFLSAGESAYTPSSADPAIIYGEACAGCHGERGMGTRFYYPDLITERISGDKVTSILREGDFMMPSFPGIQDSILVDLAGYVAERKYLEN